MNATTHHPTDPETYTPPVPLHSTCARKAIFPFLPSRNSRYQAFLIKDAHLPPLPCLSAKSCRPCPYSIHHVHFISLCMYHLFHLRLRHYPPSFHSHDANPSTAFATSVWAIFSHVPLHVSSKGSCILSYRMRETSLLTSTYCSLEMPPGRQYLFNALLTILFISSLASRDILERVGEVSSERCTTVWFRLRGLGIRNSGAGGEMSEQASLSGEARVGE